MSQLRFTVYVGSYTAKSRVNSASSLSSASDAYRESSSGELVFCMGAQYEHEKDAAKCELGLINMDCC